MFVWNMKLSSIPSVGGDGVFSSFFGAVKAVKHSREMIQEGYKKYQGRIFRIPELHGWHVVVTSQKHINDIRKATDDYLDFNEAAGEGIQAKHTLGTRVHEDQYHLDVVRGALTRNIGSKFDDVRDEIMLAFEDEIPARNEWIKRPGMKSVLQIVARASNRLFVGLPVCRNQEYIDLNIRFTIEVVLSARPLRLLPEFLKPLAARWLTPLQRSIKVAIKHLEPIIRERMQKYEEYGKDYADKPNDFLTWLMDVATGSRYTVEDLVMRLLNINFVAVHTSSLSFTNALFCLAAHPQYVEELRKEVEDVVKEHGWSKASLQKMRKVDSFLKESERFCGMGALTANRKVLKDFTFSDGTVVPAGTMLAIPSHALHHDDQFYQDGHEFKPFRFSEIREEDGEFIKHQMITPNSQYVFFGIGRHACPGRFFAVNELKTLLAHLLMTYDVKFENEGVLPEMQWYGVSSIPNREAEVLFRKRKM